MAKPIVLIGPMGVGKTTIGKKLARKLNLAFVDTDQIVIAKHGAIPDIFEKEGESAFRKYEEQALAEALEAVQVVATGGGAVISGANQRQLEAATVIYLSTNGMHMKTRLSQGNRPLLKTGVSDWRRIYEERRPLYERLCQIEVDCSSGSLTKTIEEICRKIEAL